MDFTVVICTWNRARLLQGTLRAVASMAVPDGLEWELVVVDNGSSDRTADVLRELATALPLRPCHEPELGLSYARNRAVARARGRWILWLDDDARPDRWWMEAYALAAEAHPEAVFMGGPIRPRFEVPPPSWLRDGWEQLSDLYSVREVVNDGPVLPAYLPFGANFALRAEGLPASPFDSALGRRGEGLVGGEEIDLIRRLMKAGGQGRWVPTAGVDHVIPRSRTRVRYVARRFRQLAREEAHLLPMGGASVLGVPAWLWKKAVEAELRYRYHRLRSPTGVWLERLREACTRWGQLQWALRR